MYVTINLPAPGVALGAPLSTQIATSDVPTSCQTPVRVASVPGLRESKPTAFAFVEATNSVAVDDVPTLNV
jgi:hypothetical protein